MVKYSKLAVLGLIVTTMVSTTALTANKDNAHAISPEVANVYTIKAGDTLWGIAQANGITLNELTTINNVNGTLIYPGDKLVVRHNQTKATTIATTNTKATQPTQNTTTATPSVTTQTQTVAQPTTQTQTQTVAQPTTQTQTQTVAQPNQNQPITQTNQTQLSDSEFNTLCAIVQQEAGVDYNNAKAVMSAIYNRVHSGGQFPSTYMGVIAQSGQFASYGTGAYTKHLGNISNGVRQGVTDVLNNGPIHNYKFFWSAAYAASQGRSGQNIGGNVFFNY